FTGCNLANIKVDGCGFRSVNFNGCKLIGIVFIKINKLLLDWSFQKCKIALCNFSGLDIKHSRFGECVIQGSDFVNADLRESDFSGCDLQNSTFRKANLEKANFTGAWNYYIDPTQNKVKGARFSYPEALSLLTSFGIKIE
ncbi:MAG: pentapeptide repeat-containing protein, partial [Candidatus Margulisbacteria bacterium]|nr:pentapeptide repeat-containing protein [Candidatus Margulisiibacteriota bacterium]